MIGDLFEIDKTLSFNTDKLVDGNDFDYVTRTSFNQGILRQTGFVNSENINLPGTWSLGLLQMDFFYRSKPWYAGQFVRKITPKFDVTESNILFFSSILNNLKSKLLSVLVRTVDKVFIESTIYLPTKNGEIDFEFMDSFVAELEAHRVAELEAHRVAELEAYLNVTGLKDYELTKEEKNAIKHLETVEWYEYRIGDLFEIRTGRDVIINKTKIGNIPLISHQHENNGISKYIELLENRILFDPDKTISLADRGVFKASVQKDKFHIGTRVKALVFNDGYKTKNNRLFITAAINKLQILFKEYSENATNKLPNYKIQLPTKNGEIDFEYMETLIKAIQKLVIKDVVLYADEKIELTRKVINKNNYEE